MRLSLRTSLTIGIVPLIGLSVAQALVSLRMLADARSASLEQATDLIPSIRLMGEIGLEATRYRLRASRHAAATSPEQEQEIDGQLDTATKEIATRFAHIERLLSDDRERQAWQAFLDDWGVFLLRQEEALAASRRGDKLAAGVAIEEARDLFLGAVGKLTREIEILDGAIAEASRRAGVAYRDAVSGVLLLGLFTVVVGAAVWFHFGFGTARAVDRLTRAMRSVADGDLSTPVPSLERSDEVGCMAKALVVFRDHLAEAEELRRQREALDFANLKLMNEAQEELAFRAELLDDEVSRKKAELVAREREIVWRLSRATERRDNETGDHIVRMSRISGIVAEALGMSEEDCHLVEIASQMHDIGKVAIPDQILFKPGPLTPEERAIMETHALAGWSILKGSESRLIRMAADVAVSHHEKWDGTGYPHRLSGEGIPISGRIAAIADVFDALMSRRPYKEAWSLERARAFVEENAGRHFDPACVAAFLSRWDEISAIAGTSAEEVAAMRSAA